MPRIVLENLLRSHLADGLRDARPHEVDDIGPPDEVHEGNNHQPNQQGAAADDEGILKADDIAQSQHGGAGVHLEDQLGFVREGGTPAHHRGGDGLRPGAEGGHGKVVQAAYETGRYERLGAGAAALAADEYLRGGGGLREGVLPVHLLHEVFTERNEEQDAQHAAQQRTQDHLPEIHLNAQNVDGRQGEDGARHHGAGTAAHALDNHVLAKPLFEAQGAREAHGDDGDGNGRLEHLAHLKAQVRRRGTEKNDHQQTDGHGIRSGFRILLLRIQDGSVLLSRLQLPVRVLRQLDLFFLFHSLSSSIFRPDDIPRPRRP